MTRARLAALAGRPAALAAAAGVVFATATPPLGFGPGVLAGLALLALALRRARGYRSAAVAGLVFAAVAQLIVLRFVVTVVGSFTGGGPAAGVLALVLLSLAQSLGWALAGVLARLLARRTVLPFEVGFAIAAVAASAAPGVFTWSPAGLLTVWPQLVQLADWIGELGVTALVAGLAALTIRGLDRPGGRRAVAVPLATALAAIVALHAVGVVRMGAVADAPRARLQVGLVDAGISAATRSDQARWPAVVERLRERSREADRRGAQLVVWPESAFPYPLAHAAPVVNGTLSPVAGGAAVPRIFGLGTFGGTPEARRWWNSVALVEPDGTLQRPVDKRRLLPFGERVPLRAELGWLRDGFARASEAEPGHGTHALLLRRPDGLALRLGILNCYEDMDRLAGRDLARRVRPQLIVNVANAAWYDGTTGADIQAQLAALRAVELRTDVVRAANTRGGTWIDAAGRRRLDAGGAVELVGAGLRPAGASPTPWARTGDAPLWVLVGLLVAGGGVAARRRRAAGSDREALEHPGGAERLAPV